MTTFRSEPAEIRIAAAVIVDGEGRTLLVRKRGTAAFMQPGGKVGSGETASGALLRELREELGCGTNGAPSRLGTFRAAAANEADTIVIADLFAVDLAGDVEPAAEIEEAIWIDPDDEPAVALAPLTRRHALPLAREIKSQAAGRTP